MSLYIYEHENEIPKDKPLVTNNDLFFDEHTELTFCIFVMDILADIDKAEYIDENHFLGRTKSLGALDKSCLSTGTKTLINIYTDKEHCFDVSYCGNNALVMLPRIKDGHIFWERPAAAYVSDDDSCDIIFRGKHYTSFLKFLDEV